MIDFSKIVVLNRKPMPYDHRDYRLADYITPVMRKRAAAITKQEWAVAHILDQGSSPHCVGFAWADFGISLPVFDDWQSAQGDAIYYAAKVFDGEPGAEDGSTTRSGVQAFMEFAKLQGNTYAFANAMQDVITWVLTTGPVITGTNWYDGMFTPDANGLVKISGKVAGGHEWEISGVDTVARLFKCTNSWGTAFGVGGQFYIGFDDYQRLLNESGDACTAVEITPSPTPNPTPTPTPTPTPSPTPTPAPPPGCLTIVSLGLMSVGQRLAARDLQKRK